MRFDKAFLICVLMKSGQAKLLTISKHKLLEKLDEYDFNSKWKRLIEHGNNDGNPNLRKS